VKYIIAPSLTLRKFDEFKNYKVVKEGWIVESCKEGKMLDWTKWKLQIAGGWEENGRKGLEGFLRGEPSQRRSEVVEDLEEEEEEEEVEEPLEDGNPRQGDIPPTTSIPTATPVARGSLIAPNQTQPKASTNIPLSRQDPAVRWREMLPIKDDKPEGPWENYYTKSSNDHAAEALRNSEWRIKNTAERGNEGGFIDGYYQNSRYVLQNQEEWTGC
jgi:DNA repair protein REV1